MRAKRTAAKSRLPSSGIDVRASDSCPAMMSVFYTTKGCW